MTNTLPNRSSTSSCNQTGSFLGEIDPAVSGVLKPVERHVAKGGTLFHDGDELTHLYEIATGMVKTSRLFADGRRQVIGFFTAGDFIGMPYAGFAAFSAEAVMETRLHCYPITQVAAAMTQSSALTKAILKALHDDAERHVDHVMSLGRRRPDERVASFLLKCCTKQHEITTSQRTPCVDLPMTRVDIADYLGLTQETVCRVLTRFKRTGIIHGKDSHKLTVNDLPSLQMVAELGACA
ncbi:Crp/Fnr family transcriptional regulator [Pseudokordiimonas caeni]|uniref:Crp/Fnr family transcriptional regulator n=1 Tax=Pseudokordiimonas caeni TaxID=2997908 RepID=UPI002811DF25|nr:Crp/Fnr family transcriptional regulator [Pseudokordiimonas caeni]